MNVEKIIQLNKSYVNQMADVDYEAEHKMKKENKVPREKMLKEIISRFNKKQELNFGYFFGKNLAGYGSIKLFFPGYNHCEIYWLDVKKKYQGKGIGTKLIDFLEKYAKKKGFRKVFIYTNKTMTKTRKFYQSHSYKLINEFPKYYNYKKNNTAVLYGKEL